MGGAVGFVFRDNDGSTQFVLAFTKGMTNMASHADTLNSKNDFILKSFKECGYKQYDVIAISPQGYGLFVVDFKSKHLLSCQGYGSIDTYCLPTYSEIAEYQKWYREDANEFEYSVYDSLIASNRLLVYPRIQKNGEWVLGDKVDISGLEPDALLAKLRKEEAKRRMFEYKINLSPFTLIKYQETPAGYIAMREKLIELGFGVDKKEWNKQIKKMQNDQGEDGEALEEE